MTQQNKSTYTVADLQAMPDGDLNTLAAELRGIKQIGGDNRGGDWVDEIFVPATDRDQSGELLQWLFYKHSFAGCLNYTSPPSIEIWTSGRAAVISVAIPGNTARAETIAFCAAMLAMEKRLQ